MRWVVPLASKENSLYCWEIRGSRSIIVCAIATKKVMLHRYPPFSKAVNSSLINNSVASISK